LLALVAGTLIGIILTLIAGSEPGFLLGLFITLGAVVGVLGVRRGAVYLFFPLPPFAFFVGAVITGKVHDSGITSTTTGLYASLLQWIAYIFFPMCVATIGVLLIGGIRWVLGLMFVSGQLPMSGGGPGAPRGPRPRTAPGPRTDIDPWADPNIRTRRQAAVDVPRADDPRAASTQSERRPGNAPWLGPNGARPAAPAREPRADRDPWGDPRPGTPADRRPGTTADRRPQARNAPPLPAKPPAPKPAAPKPTVARPAAAPPAAQPSFRPRPANPAPPGDRAPRPPAPQRPVRPPNDRWDQGSRY
jgi:hypothetical protein